MLSDILDISTPSSIASVPSVVSTQTNTHIMEHGKSTGLYIVNYRGNLDYLSRSRRTSIVMFAEKEGKGGLQRRKGRHS